MRKKQIEKSKRVRVSRPLVVKIFQDELVYPFLLSIPIGDAKQGRQFKVWCPHCANWHYHGASSGHRAKHCFSIEGRKQMFESGYVLKRIPKKEAKKLIKELTDYVNDDSWEQFKQNV